MTQRRGNPCENVSQMHGTSQAPTPWADRRPTVPDDRLEAPRSSCQSRQARESPISDAAGSSSSVAIARGRVVQRDGEPRLPLEPGNLPACATSTHHIAVGWPDRRSRALQVADKAQQQPSTSSTIRRETPTTSSKSQSERWLPHGLRSGRWTSSPCKSSVMRMQTEAARSSIGPQSLARGVNALHSGRSANFSSAHH